MTVSTPTSTIKTGRREMKDLKEGKAFKDFRRQSRNYMCADLEDHMYLNWRTSKQKEVTNPTSNNEKGVPHRDYEVKKTPMDMTPYHRIYKPGVFKLARLKVEGSLTVPGLLMFLVLSSLMDKSNKATFNYFKDYHKLGYGSYVPCRNGIINLLQNGLIELTKSKHSYWVDPYYVSKDNRYMLSYRFNNGLDTEDGQEIDIPDLLTEEEELIDE